MERRSVKSSSSEPEAEAEAEATATAPFSERKKNSSTYTYGVVVLIFMSLVIFLIVTNDGTPRAAVKQDFSVLPNVAISPPNPTVVVVPTNSPLKNMAIQNKKCLSIIEDVRNLKSSGVVMETDERALKLIAILQSELKKLLTMRFGEKPMILIEMQLVLPETMPDVSTKGRNHKLTIEMAPIDLVPYSVYNFLEIVRRFKVYERDFTLTVEDVV